MSPQRSPHLALLGALFLGLALTACRPVPSLAGRWRTEPPASLLYEYRADGVVTLVKENRQFIVFHYQLLDEDTLKLYDGMGRVRQYDFRISGETLLLYEDLNSGIVVEKYRREE